LPVYDLAAVAEAVNLDQKQLDNLISRNALPGVERKNRGVARRLTSDVAVTLCLARELAVAFEVPLAKALPFAQKVIGSGAIDLDLGQFMTLRVDEPALRASIAGRLDTAVEIVGRRRRGRPPRNAALDHGRE
jgi:hypothetical protein